VSKVDESSFWQSVGDSETVLKAIRGAAVWKEPLGRYSHRKIEEKAYEDGE
jgi:hypothetical protein